jgi:hypothetical protein
VKKWASPFTFLIAFYKEDIPYSLTAAECLAFRAACAGGGFSSITVAKGATKPMFDERNLL